MKSKLRLPILKLMNATGIFDAWKRLHRHDISVLMLHGTADPKRPSQWTPLRYQTSPDYIDWCLNTISKHYRFISLEHAASILKGEKPPLDYGFVITFDDGFKSNIVDALPVMKKYGVPITIFLTVSNIENRKPLLFDRLDYAIQKSTIKKRDIQIGSNTFHFDGSNLENLKNTYARFRQTIKKELTNENDFLFKLEEITKNFEHSCVTTLENIFEDDPWSSLLNWEEISSLNNSDVVFGSHTMDHTRVGNIESDAILYQLSESKKRIEEKTGVECKNFAYPDGSFNDNAALIARECGYHAAVTTMEGLNKIGCDIMKIKRVHFPITSDPVELLAYVSGLSIAMSRMS